MSNISNKPHEIDDDDDEEDADYVPEGADESISNDEIDELDKTGQPKKRKLKNNKKLDSEDELDEYENENQTNNKESKTNDAEEPLQFDKKKADDLWSSFLKDVKPASTSKTSQDSSIKKYETAEIKNSVI